MIDIKFSWTRFHSYEIAKVGSRKLIRPAGRKSDQVDPLKIETDKPLFSRFAALDGSDEAISQFAQTWGLLRSEKSTEGEFLPDWQAEIERMRQQITFLTDEPPRRPANGGAWKMTALDVLLVPKSAEADGDRYTMLLQPRNLLEAMNLQLAKSVASGGAIRACKQCGEWFEAGAGESRRSIAIFCSEKCKNRFHYLERSSR
jgi:hypothetical protein